MGFDSCDRPSNLTQIGFKSSIFRPWDLEIWWLTPKNNEARRTENTIHRAAWSQLKTYSAFGGLVLVPRWFTTGHKGRPHLWNSLITSYRILYDVITYPRNNKISVQLKEFTGACMKMRMGIWMLKDISQQYSPIRASWWVMSLQEHSVGIGAE